MPEGRVGNCIMKPPPGLVVMGPTLTSVSPSLKVIVRGTCCRALGCAGRPSHTMWPNSTAVGVAVGVLLGVRVRVGVQVGVTVGVGVEGSIRHGPDTKVSWRPLCTPPVLHSYCVKVVPLSRCTPIVALLPPPAI